MVTSSSNLEWSQRSLVNVSPSNLGFYATWQFIPERSSSFFQFFISIRSRMYHSGCFTNLSFRKKRFVCFFLSNDNIVGSNIKSDDVFQKFFLEKSLNSIPNVLLRGLDKLDKVFSIPLFYFLKSQRNLTKKNSNISFWYQNIFEPQLTFALLPKVFLATTV